MVAGRAHRRVASRDVGLITTDASGRLVIVDYETTTDASPEGGREILYRYGYWMQDELVPDCGRVILGVHLTRVPAGDTVPRLAPYLVSGAPARPRGHRAGTPAHRDAIDLWHRCRQEGHLAGVGTVYSIEIPRWAR